MRSLGCLQGTTIWQVQGITAGKAAPYQDNLPPLREEERQAKKAETVEIKKETDFVSKCGKTKHEY